ncbi:MAG: hypothetical protein K8H86_02850 [Ignavibacteriaceae bacterium]|nr:hypothetical protein [Ignavibacteriaceae bacterium]
MKGIIVSSTNKEDKLLPNRNFQNFLFAPFKAGLVGFSSFFTILLIAKYAGSLFGTANSFKIQTEDVFLSLIGFTLLFLVKLLENVSKKNGAKT